MRYTKYLKLPMDYFHYVLTPEKEQELDKISDVQIEILSGGKLDQLFDKLIKRPFACLRTLRFQESVPLRVTYWEKSRVLKRIDLVEGYEYTEEQRRAIKRINQMYP